MASSSNVSAGDDILASQYNNLRQDAIHATLGHKHTGAADDGTKLVEASYGAATIPLAALKSEVTDRMSPKTIQHGTIDVSIAWNASQTPQLKTGNNTGNITAISATTKGQLILRGVEYVSGDADHVEGAIGGSIEFVSASQLRARAWMTADSGNSSTHVIRVHYTVVEFY